MIKKILLILLILKASILLAQTPGMVIKSVTAPGKAILDPDGDGYVSMKTSGVQIGFLTNDIAESEIPYAPIVKPDPQGDPLAGPSCLYNEIVGTDAAGNNAVMSYFDGTNLLFRFRLGGYAANSKGYSLLIDTDQKFGFTGPNADPNAVVGNPGFEVEIVLETNFGVEVYKVDGTASPINVIPFSTNPYSTNCQKSMALTTACSDPDYFYDFYIPFSQLTGIPGLTIDANTPLRMVAVTSMSPHPAIGNSAISDVGGVTTGSNLDDIYSSIIDEITPTSTNNINNDGQLDRSTCPFIDPVGISNTAITGTTTETSGTVTVYVYQSNGTNLLGSASTAFSAAGNWSINVSSLSPSVILAAGQVVKATVTATGKGISYSNCNPVIVSDCSVQTSTPLASEITKISSGKGYSLTISRPIGTKVYLYTSNYALRTVSDLKNSVTNPFITTTNPQTFTFECQTGNCFGSDVYYFRYEEPGKCISPYYVSCHYASGGTSATPTISTSTITTATTSISGNGTAASSQINIYANDIQIATATSGASAPYAWTANVSSLTTCQVITARQIVSGQCLSDPSAGVTVTRSAIKPTISFNGCSATSPVTSISGYSSEANGTTIMLYTPNSSGTSLGSTTVSSGSWTKTGLNLTSGTIVAKVTSGSCLSPSPDSDPITISTKTDISGYSIAINPATEGETTVSGTISGGTYPVTIKVYVDETLVGAGIAVNSAGSWSVSGLNTFDLAVGSKVQVTLTGTGCESSLSSTYQTVGCSNPSDKTITSSSTTICSNSNGTITVQNSQSGVIYTPVLNDGVTLYGYGICGTGFDIDLVTYALTSNTTIKVKATKFPSTSCSAILSGSISFTVNPTPQAPSGASNQTFCSSGTTTLADLSVTAPSGCSLVWYNASTGGSVLPSTTNLVSGTTYYALSQNNTTGCTSTTRTAITVQSGTPAAPTAAANQSYCSGATVDDLTASLSGPGTISWYASSSGGSALATSTALVSGSTYYAETNHNSCVSSSRTAVTVTLYSSTTITGQSTAAQTQCQGGAFSSISVNVTGAGLTYQWYSNTSLSNTGGTPITGATSSSYTPSASTEGTLYYYCIVTGSCGSPATSNVSEAFIVNALPAAPTATATQSFCGSATVANLAATAPVGSAVKWYAASSDGSTLAAGTALVNSTTYYAESENTTSLCVSSSRTAVTVTINALPAAPTATATQSFCGSATVADLSATVPVNSIMKWYAASSGGSALAGATALVNGSTYYAESENTTTLCVSSLRTAVTVTINVLPAAPTATATQSFCGSATVGNLAATAPVGSNVKWYAASSGGSALEGATALVNGSTYYTESENTTSLCVSSSRTAVTVTINALPAEPTATATQSFCGSATVANLAATAPVGSTVKWYAASSGGSALAAGTALVNGSTYYAESENTTTLCVSNSRTAMTVAINSLPAVPTATATQSFCGSATIVDLSATAPVGSTVKWYAASSGGSTLEGATALVNGSTYYTESENTISLCVSSSRTAVTVTINALPAAPTATATQSFCGSATVADLSATVPVGSIMKWYAASSGGSALAEATALVNGTTYYAESENTTSLCVSSSRTAVTVNINALPAAPTATATQSFCGSATIADLSATAPVGSTVKWYAAASGGSALAGATALVNGSTYYAESENSTTLCVSSSRTAVTVTINSLPAAPTATAAQSFCGSATIADLSATAPVGSTVKWYAASSGGSTLTGATALVNSTTYYAESENTTTFCISNSRTAVTVTINVLPAAPTASVTTQPTCADATGTITITAPTGAGMTYSIDGSTYTNTTGIFTSVPVGTYTVTAKSTEGCISPATTSVTLNAPICTNLSITKTVDNSTPNVGSTVAFTLTVTNNGPDNATGVTVTDNLPSGYTYVSDDGLGAYNVGTGVWAIGNLNNGATAILNITATVKTTGNYANTATVNGDQTDPTPANNTSTNTPVPVDQCNLSIDKSVNNGSPNVGDNIIFTLTVTNNGPSDATGVKVTDNLPSGFTYVSDNGAGAYNDGTGIWTIGNLANSATTTLNITVTVNASGSYSNTATVSGDQADPTPANNSDTSTPTPGALSNLAITKTVDNSTPNVGSNVVFRLTATNNGPSDASGVKVTDLLPSGYTYVSDNSLGNYNSTTGVWSVGNLANGASSSLNITAFVKSSGVYTNTATISGDQTDPTPANNSASVATTPVAQSNLSIVKSVNNATPNVASNVVFTLTVTNNGPSDATGVSATDALPSGYTYVSDNGSGAYINGTGLWTIGNLVNGASASLDITAKVNASGSYANTATVSSPVADPTPGNNTSTSTPVPVPQSNLSITKSVSNGAPIIGSNIVFTLTATNHGPSDATGVSATDALPSGYTYVSDNGSGAYISGTGVWTIGNLANGTSASLDITAKVNASGNYTNSASVTADQPDPSTGDNTASINTTPVAQSNLTIVKTVNNSTPNVGVNVVFTLTVTNNGPSNASGVKATDALPSGYIYVSDNGSGAYNSSTGLWTIGNLNNGSTVTLDIIASVNATGNYTNTATVTGDQADPSSDDETSSVSTTPNFIPVATNDITNTNQDTPVTIDVLSNDTGLNDGPVVVTITVNPTNGTYVVNADNTITYTPNSGFTGNDSFTYKICDNNGDCATATITITVNSTSTDHLPVAVDDNTITQENIAVVISVLANDNGLEDGGLVVTVTNQPTHGTIVINPDNTITYIPSTGYVGNDSFTYQVCDADGDCSTATVSITVNATITDHVPVAVDDNTTTQENNAVVISVLANDTGLEDGGLVVTVTNQPTHGTIVINLDNTITYTPSNGYVGNDNFTYQVCDADGDCATAAVTITVNATITDHIPVAVDDNTTTQENNAVVISVLANDTGLEDGGLVITTNQPTHGTIVINLDNTITYTPSTGYVGNDSFTYQVCDADGDCATATVTITVNSTGTDHLPVAVDDNASTEKDKEVVINVLSNDTGLEDGGLAVTVVNQPIHGTIVINADNTITYTPETGYAGEDSFTYQVCDVDGDCSTAIANITIENTIIIPDGFSPNGDGINDNFVIPGLENYNRVSIDILNRWGNIVYTSSKYENNWDGRSNTGVYSGTQLPIGTYFYVVKIHDNGKKSTGYVYLTR